jgi:mono/diheme cytochrome c family protein
MIKGFLAGVIAVLLVLGLVGYIGVTQGLLIPANADDRPPKLERWAAGASLHAPLRREAPTQPNPNASTVPNLLAGVKLYNENCIVCHGAADGVPSTIAAGLYQHAPQLGKDGVEDDPEGVTFWKVKHGIRLTGMPSYGASLSDDQVWTLALFLKHMDSLPPQVDKAWKALRNPAAPARIPEHAPSAN